MAAIIEAVKTVDKAYGEPGDILTYTLTLQNNGDVPAKNIVVTDAAPAGTAFVPGSVTGATGVLPTLKLPAPILAGDSEVITFKVKVENQVPAVNPVTNSASVAYAYSVGPEGSDQTANAVSNVVSTMINVARLGVVKSADKHIAYIGDVITYHLSVKNTGNVPADNVVLTDLIPNGTEYVDGSLTVNVPHAGLPATGITLTDPVLPGQTVSVSFQIQVTAIPNPNPIINTGEIVYTYTMNPEFPDGETGTDESNPVCTAVFRYNFGQQITDLIESVALEQAALGNIANAEGAKIQAMVQMGDVTTPELLCLNESVADMLDSISMLESLLRKKLKIVSCQIESGNCVSSCN